MSKELFDDVEKGDGIIAVHPVRVRRYNGFARINHWITAICLVLLLLSGLSMFYPTFFFLTALFGGGQFTRMIHPWIGVVLCLSFAILFIQFWRANLIRREDIEWMSHPIDVISANEDKLPEVGKYNGGQKGVFWSMTLLILALIVTGLVIWQEYFGAATSIETQRWALLIHALAAVAIILVWIVHVYAAIWVKGTMSAMTKGTVSGGWAYRHHRKWFRELVANRKARLAKKTGQG